MLNEILDDILKGISRRQRIVKIIEDKTNNGQNEELKTRSKVRRQLAENFVLDVQEGLVKQANDLRLNMGLCKHDNEVYIVIKMTDVSELLITNIYKFIRSYTESMNLIKKNLKD